MDEKMFRGYAVKAVVDYFNSHSEKTDENNTITEHNVYVVWECKTLQNNKAMISTEVSDGMYYEVTFNGDKNELYLDAYKKFNNVCIATPVTEKKLNI